MAHTSDVRFFGTSVFSNFADLRGAIANRVDQHRTYSNTLRELESLTNRELNDLGLSRHSLKAIAREAAYGAV